MIVTITYKGKKIGRPMNDLKEDNLLRFIQAEIELGRTVHIIPEEKDPIQTQQRGGVNHGRETEYPEHPILR